MSDNFNNTTTFGLETADSTEASEKYLNNGQLLVDFSQNKASHQVLTSEVLSLETDLCNNDAYYYPPAKMSNSPGTIIALEPVVLSDENDSDAPLLGSSLDSLETVGMEPSIPLEQNSNYLSPNEKDDSIIDICSDKIVEQETQENSLYNGSYVGSTGSDIPLLGTSPGNEQCAADDINFNPIICTSTEPLVDTNPINDPSYGYEQQPSIDEPTFFTHAEPLVDTSPVNDPGYGYEQPSIEDPIGTFYSCAEPDFVPSYVGTSQTSDIPLLGSSFVDFETAESNDVVNENEISIFNYVDPNANIEANTFPQLSQLPSGPSNDLLSYLDQSLSEVQRDSISVCESQDIFQEAELRQFHEAEQASCSLANNQANNNVNIVNSILVCAAETPVNNKLGTSNCIDDCDALLVDLSLSVPPEDVNPILADKPAESLVADIPVEEFTVDQNHQPITANFENVDETRNDLTIPYNKQISTESTAPLIIEEPVKHSYCDLEIPSNYRVIECEPSFNMSKASPFLHLYGSSRIHSSPHLGTKEHVNLSEACLHMLNHLNNSYSNMSLMQISSVKDIRDIHLENLDSSSEEESPGKHWKNLFAYSIGFMVMYMAFGSLRHLQSSLNSEAGVGLMTLSCLFAFFVIGSLFASYIVKKLEPRRATLVTVLFHLLYVISNCYPKVYILMPVSALLGFWNAVSWGASGTYIQRLACHYASKTNQKTEHVCSKFHGIFYLIIFFSEVFGNLISSVILGSNSSVPVISSSNTTMSLIINETLPGNHSNQYSHCGVSYSHSDDVNTETVQVDQSTIYMLTAVFAGMDILAFIILFFGVDPLTMYYKSETATDTRTCWQVWTDVKAVIIFMTDWRFIMLIPLYMFSAIHIGYISADITKAFVTCLLGIHMVGYMMICYGISDAFSSYITGWLNQFSGRMLIILFLLLWQPDPTSLVPFILIFAIWGLSDGFYASQLCSLTGVMFADTCEEAFSAYRMMQGVGLTVAYSYAPILPLDIKLYMLSGLGIVAWVLYIAMEYLNKRSERIKTLMVDYRQTTV